MSADIWLLIHNKVYINYGMGNKHALLLTENKYIIILIFKRKQSAT